MTCPGCGRRRVDVFPPRPKRPRRSKVARPWRRKSHTVPNTAGTRCRYPLELTQEEVAAWSC